MLVQDGDQRKEELERKEELKQIVYDYIAATQSHDRDLEKSNSAKKVGVMLAATCVFKSTQETD